MAETTNSPEKPANPNSPQPISQSDPHDLPPPPTSSAATTPPPNPNPVFVTPPQPSFLAQPPPQQLPSFPSYAPPQLQVSTAAPASFRPGAPPIPFPAPPQFSPIPNIGFQQQSQGVQVQPPGVSPGSVTVSYGQLPPMRPYGVMTNGYLTMPQGIMQPPGIPRYPSMYPGMIRPAFPQRPPGIVGTLPALVRHPVPGIRGPIIPPIIRPLGIPSVIPAEKPQTTVYVGKISTTIDNEFMMSVLQLCGPVKSWKRAQDPTSGLLKGFGICEFDSAEGVLRAIRLLSKLNVDGQEFMLNFSQATKEYLARYVEKKRENSKSSEATGPVGAVKDEEGAPGAEKDGPAKSSKGDTKEDVDDISNKDSQGIAKFGIVTDEDRQADQEALEKLTVMLEERRKANPLPPPPPPPPPPTTMATEGSGTSHSEVPSRSRDLDSDTDMIDKDAAEARNGDEITSEIKVSSEHDKAEPNSPSRNRKTGRGRNRDRDAKQEKERELEIYEREREQDRVKREKDREYRIREDERRYRVRVKDWESREREKERMRKLEREREKEREQERKWEIMDQENESDDGYSKKRKHKSSAEERKRRQREKDEDLADRLKEMEEIAEAKRKAEEEQEKQKLEEEHLKRKLEEEHVKRKLEEEHVKRKLEEEHVKRKLEDENTKFLFAASAATYTINKSEEASLSVEVIAGNKDKVIYQPPDGDSEQDNHMIDMFAQNGTGDESGLASVSTPDMHQSSNAQTRKLGFGLVGSGKRTAVPSVFHEEEDEDAKKDKKMRPLVPIDYTTEELQAVQNNLSGAPSPNLAAAAEFAKRISSVNSKEERPESDKDRSKRSHDRSSLRDRERTDHETNRVRDSSRKETTERDKERERGSDKMQTRENKKLLDAKQLIDTIPKTKDELFSYEINWAVYDKNVLHERMRPWISKKITEFLGEEETTLVDYIVATTQEHVDASEVLQRLQSILDDEAEMFVLKMWRMLIFEIKKVETGLALRS